ncbi:MAG: superfamily II DNA or RNA helicase [Verrucomicrobiales bacterium]
MPTTALPEQSESVLTRLSISHPPFNGEFFTRAQIKRGIGLFENGAVRVITCNASASFAGIFGVVSDHSTGQRNEVSAVVKLNRDGSWSLEGTADGTQKNGAQIVALLLGAGAQYGEVEAPAIETSGCVVELSCQDVRAGILNWEESDTQGLTEHMRLARISRSNKDLENLLRSSGLKLVEEIYPYDEIDPSAHGCFAFPAKNLAIQTASWASFLANQRKPIEALGAQLVIDNDSFNIDLIDSADDFYGELHEDDNEDKDGIDWLGFEYGIKVGRQKVNILPGLVEYLASRPVNFSLQQLKDMPDGSKVAVKVQGSERYAALPAKRLHSVLEILAELLGDERLINKTTGQLKIHRLSAAQIAQPDVKLVDTAPENFFETSAEIEALKPKVPVDVPKGFLADLRPYQQHGFEWLQFLREQNLGGILADDMGLGKTIQTLCHLHHEKQSGRANLPCLIIAPKSVVPNWEKETRKFAPSLSVLTLEGPKRKRYYPVLQHADLVVTSYPVLLRDAEELLAQEFHYVVLDEAHTIKNATSQVTKIAYQINARHRLALSGTPIENHLGELWSLFHFLMPGYLGSELSFQQSYRIPIEKHRDEASFKRLAKRVRPLMLRRTKTLVAKDLPEKTEIIQTIDLTPKQIELYEAVRASIYKDLNAEIDRRGLNASKILILDALMKLRQVCCHPRLLKLPAAQKAKNSAKLDHLMQMIIPMVEQGRRILVFSQFTGMISLIEQELERENITYQSLTGASKNRGELTEKFQAGKIPVFLISLRAGGTGITLTAADTVIHYDPWWNPALEMQATDRAYRIGQKNPVFVYKLISKGTIEEKIVMLQQKKRALFEGILEGTPQKLEFSETDLENLFAPLKP